MRATLRNLALAGLSVALAACAADSGRYPSLALRPFETAAPVTTEPEAPAPIRPAIDPARLAALRERADAAHAAFVKQQAAAAPLVRTGAGQSVESNARAAALVALADLRSKRSATAVVLADLDILNADTVTALAPDPALAAAQAEVATLVASEDEALAQLAQVLGQ